MYCSVCGTEANRNFCGKCGTKIESKSSETNMDMEERNILNGMMEKNICEYLKEQGKNTKMTVREYFENFNPLTKIRIISFGTIMLLLSIFVSVSAGLLLGPMIGLPIYVFYLSGKLAKEDLKVYENKEINKHENIGEEVFDYIRKNKIYNEITLDEFSENSVRIIFNKQSYHRITFDKEKNIYRICANGATLKQGLKSGSRYPGNILYKNAKHVNPLLRALIDRYLEQGTIRN